MNRDSLVVALNSFKSVIKQLIEESNNAKDIDIYNKLLDQGSYIISIVENNASTEEEIHKAVDTMERLFGNCWLSSDDDHHTAYSSWDTFKSLMTRSIQGMTVNERLFVLGLVNDFDSAVACKDRQRLHDILSKCCLEEQNIQDVINAVLSNKISKILSLLKLKIRTKLKGNHLF